MQDEMIVALYWKRDEKAISETERKYGRYLSKIAYNKQLQKLIEQAQNFQKTQPIHDEYKQIRWKGKQEKFAEAHRADLAVWDAANRYLRANLPDMKLTPKAWQTELAALTAENEAEYARLKAQREEVTELQKVRRYVDVALKADAPQKAKTKHHDIDR